MFITELFEAHSAKHAAFCFGRMNPPTAGHKLLIDTVAKASQGGDYFVFTSQTHDAKKNPLDYNTKIKFLKALFPEHSAHVVNDSSLNTIMKVAAWLYNKGYRSVTFAAGGDRLADFEKLLNTYNGREDVPHYYKFDNISFVSSGDRDPDSDGVAGANATAARVAAKEGDEAKFAQATRAGQLAPELYKAVRKGMNLAEDASGYIPKNKREAKDPRWANALTVDVHPDTPYKNAKALRLVK